MKREIAIIPDRVRIKESIELAREYDAVFEYNDFMMGTCLWEWEKARERIDFYRQIPRDRSGDTLHGAFIDMYVHSADPEIRRIARMRIETSLQIARELGVKGVIFHTNCPQELCHGYYLEKWLDKNERFWREKLEQYESLEIYMENMFDQTPDACVKLAQRLTDQKRFGLCLDYAHAGLYGSDILGWVRQTAPYVRHLHINDTDLETDGHLEVGKGRIDWGQFSRLSKKYLPGIQCLIEVRGLGAQRRSLEFLEKYVW